MNRHPSVDVIIPAYRPDVGFSKIITALEGQSYPPAHIIILNSDEKAWNDVFIAGHPKAEVYHISRDKYDEGAVRNMGAGFSNADILVFMSQNAIPDSRRFISKLLRPFADSEVKAVYAREIPDFAAPILDTMEMVVAFPEENQIFTGKDMRKLTRNTRLLSNVCAAYDRRFFESAGRFLVPAITWEDVHFAAKVIDAGYRVAYNARCGVIVRCRNSVIKCFRRGFDEGVSEAVSPRLLGGMKNTYLSRDTRLYIKEAGSTGLLFKYNVRRIFKKIGSFLGKRYRHLPFFICKFLSGNRLYWDNRRRGISSLEYDEF